MLANSPRVGVTAYTHVIAKTSTGTAKNNPLTGFNCLPLIPGEPFVLKFLSCNRQGHSNDLGPPLAFKVHQFVARHFVLQLISKYNCYYCIQLLICFEPIQACMMSSCSSFSPFFIKYRVGQKRLSVLDKIFCIYQCISVGEEQIKNTLYISNLI